MPPSQEHVECYSHPPENRRSLRLLVVDDHADTAAMLARFLRKAGYETHTAASVGEAFTKATAQRFDILISDMGLPDGSGIDLMQRVREQYPIQGIAVSGNGMEADVERCLEAGFARHLLKPILLDRLRATVHELSGIS